MKKIKTISVKDLEPGRLYWWKRKQGNKVLIMFLKNNITKTFKPIVEMTYLYATKETSRISLYCDSLSHIDGYHSFWEAC